MTPEQRAQNYARTFPDYPPLTYDDRWLHGMWLLGQAYKGSGFYGAFPPTLLPRLQALFPKEFRGKVLHLFSGSLDASVGGVRVDRSLERDPPPDIFADAHHLPFANGTFDLIVADPPYFTADAKRYGTPPINRAKVFRECARVLKEGGQLIWLDARSPMHRKNEWLWWGIVGVSRSTNHIYRALTFYQRRKSIMSKLRTKLAAASEKFAAAFAILLGEDEASVAEAMAAQKRNTKIRETGEDEDEDKPKRGRPKKTAKPDDDEDEDDDKPAKKKGPKPPADEDEDDEDEDDDEGADIPKDAALADLSREDLKKLAKSNGIDPIGKNREDLTKLLQKIRDGKKSTAKTKPADDDDEDEDDDEEKPAKKKKKPVADDEDDDEEKPAKKKKKPAQDDDEDKPEEDDYPKLKVMKADLEAFFKLNKDMLTASGFFGGKVKKGVAKSPRTYDEVMEDPDLIKEDWADNIWPEIQSGNWKKMKAEADAMDDEDDDE